MSNELQTNLDAILNDKNTNCLPENLKSGVTLLGITGTLELGMPNEEVYNCNEIALRILGASTNSLYKQYISTAITEEDKGNESTGYSANRIDFSEEALSQSVYNGKTLKEVLNDYPYVTLFYEHAASFPDSNVFFSKEPLTVNGPADGTNFYISREGTNSALSENGWCYLDKSGIIHSNTINTPFKEEAYTGYGIQLPITGDYVNKIMIFANYPLTVTEMI